MLPTLIREEILMGLFIDDHRYVTGHADKTLARATLRKEYQTAGRIFEALIDSLPVEMIEGAMINHCGNPHRITVAALKRIVAGRAAERRLKAITEPKAITELEPE